MAAEHLPDRDTLIGWLKDSDATVKELTDLFDDAMDAMSNLIDSHHFERLVSERAHQLCIDALVHIRWVLDDVHVDPDEMAYFVREIVDEVIGPESDER